MARIALVHDVAGVAETQAEVLRRAGHQVDQLRLNDFGATWGFFAKAVTLPIRLFMYLPTILQLRREPYDVIHIHWVPRGMVGVLSGRPFLIQAHGSDLHQHMRTPGMRGLCNLVLRRARAIFYVTPNLEPYLQQFAAKSVYLPNPINVETHGLVPVPAGKIRRVLIFTRLDPVKGVDRVFPAVQRVAAMGIEVTAVKSGPLMEQYVNDYSRFVRFVEPVSHDRVAAVISSFDLVIGQMKQGVLGLSELEAMAVGRPVITGIDAALYPDDRPPVIFAQSPEQVVHEVRRLKDDSPRLDEFFREGREWIRRNHGFERHRAILEEVYFGVSEGTVDTPVAM